MAELNCTLTPEQRQERADGLRAILTEWRVYPTLQGERAARDEAAGIRQDLAGLLPGLDAADLFALQVLAYSLAGTEASGWQRRYRALALATVGTGPQSPDWWWETFVIALGYTRRVLTGWARSLWRHKLAAR